MNKKNKTLILILICTMCLIGTTACTNRAIELNKNTITQIPNPWTDCGKDFAQASKIAGFEFPLKLPNFSIRAMKDMIEITYKADNLREFTIRKSVFEYNNGDISGDYNIYPVKKTVTLENGVNLSVRGNDNLFYVMNFSASNGYYSVSCEQGMSLKDLQNIYELIAEAEEPSLI